MPTHVALIAERDPSLRALMSEALQAAGFDVKACAGAHQLGADLGPVAAADCCVLVLHMEIVARCIAEICTLIRERWAMQLSRVHVIFVCEFGALSAFPNLGDYHFAGLLEKPFDFDDLQRLARGCRIRFGGRQINQA